MVALLCVRPPSWTGLLPLLCLLLQLEERASPLQGRNRQCITLDLHKEKGRDLVTPGGRFASYHLAVL